MSEKKKVVIRPLEEMEAEMIKVTDKYLIAVTTYDYAVRIKGNSRPIAYFGNFGNALAYVRSEMIRDGLEEARDVIQAANVFQSVDRTFSAIIGDKFPEYDVVKRK